MNLKLKAPQLFWIIVFCLSFDKIYAQEGQVVTLKGDTLNGEISFSNIEGKVDKVWLRQNNNKRQLFTALQVRSLRVDSVDYKVVNYGGYRFMMVEKSGYLSLLKFRSPGSFSFDQTLLYKLDGNATEIPILNFRKPMAIFLSDCDEVSTRIRNRELQSKDLNRIIDEFNFCIERKTNENAQTPVFTEDEKQRKEMLLELVTKLKGSTKANDGNSQDFLAIVYDLESKIKSGSQIPSYLIRCVAVIS